MYKQGKKINVVFYAIKYYYNSFESPTLID